MGPGGLAEILDIFQANANPDVLVGLKTSDDAGVYKLNDSIALVQTVDFFTPIVDDPYLFGQIAAANSLSDIYAMGAKPLTALNLVAFPKSSSLPAETLPAILKGGLDKTLEAGAVILGGHTIEDAEPKYGLCVTGITHPARIWTNAGAKPGDSLILTKKLGTGILATAAKAQMFKEGVAESCLSMAALNAVACSVGTQFSINACTDITGFGLLGHTSEIAKASRVNIELDSPALPIFNQAAEAARMGLVPGGAYANRQYFSYVTFAADVPEYIRDICFDPQTSGGLLFSLPTGQTDKFITALHEAGVSEAAIIGQVTSEVSLAGECGIYVK